MWKCNGVPHDEVSGADQHATSSPRRHGYGDDHPSATPRRPCHHCRRHPLPHSFSFPQCKYSTSLLLWSFLQLQLGDGTNALFISSFAEGKYERGRSRYKTEFRNNSRSSSVNRVCSLTRWPLRDDHDFIKQLLKIRNALLRNNLIAFIIYFCFCKI